MPSGSNPNSRANLALGGWKKGQSGNPSGRPKAVAKVEELARAKTERCIEILFEIAEDVNAPHNSRVAAANSLLARGWGHPRSELAVVEPEVDYSDWSDYELEKKVATDLQKFLNEARIIDGDEALN